MTVILPWIWLTIESRISHTVLCGKSGWVQSLSPAEHDPSELVCSFLYPSLLQLVQFLVYSIIKTDLYIIQYHIITQLFWYLDVGNERVNLGLQSGGSQLHLH